MAKYEKQFRGDFDKTLRYLHDGILRPVQNRT